MKSLFVLITLSLSASMVFSQADRFEYAQVFITYKINGEVVMDVYSEENTPEAGRDFSLKTQAGKKMQFENYIVALNHLGAQGWEMIQFIPAQKTLAKAQPLPSYLFKRRIETPSE